MADDDNTAEKDDKGGTPPPALSPHFFNREPDGWVRLRLRLDPETARLIEEAAGETPLTTYIYRALPAIARHHIRERQRERSGSRARPNGHKAPARER